MFHFQKANVTSDVLILNIRLILFSANSMLLYTILVKCSLHRIKSTYKRNWLEPSVILPQYLLLNQS